ncbi:MAG: sugar phosphate isomerase/epimerase [Oscillospiraceae bacterium]|nr:sugar phosphate isomerase/epimerase [Oscillospiraceae bacterium]
MQLGIRIHDGEKLPLEELLPILRKRGFLCGHIALSKSISHHSTDVSAMTPGLAMYLKKLFFKNDMDIAVIGCYLNLAVPDSEKLRQNTEKYMAHIRFASILGCGVVGTETGAPNMEYKYEPECRSDKSLDIFIKNLRPIVEYAEKMGVIVAIEPVLKHIVYSPRRARKVLDEIGSPNLQIIFDPVNLLGTENYQNRTQVINEAIELLGKDIACVHIKDFKVDGDELTACAAGTGEMDYTDIMRFIKYQKPYIHVTLENTVPENSEKAREYIESVMSKV